MNQIMEKRLRAILIRKSIKCRAFKQEDETIFVNIVTPTRSICFTCKINQLIKNLKVPAFELMPLIKEVSFKRDSDKKVMICEDLYFVKDEIYNNTFVGELSNGSFVRSPLNKLNFEYIFPTTKEYQELILKSLEEF